MPRYDFRCSECKETKEIFTRSPTETFKIPLCELCKKEMLKIFSVFGVKFVGNGFYTTDTRRSQ